MNNLNIAPISGTTISVYSPIIFIATTIAWFFVFEENKIPGWKAIIPIYGEYTKFKLFYNVKAFFLSIIFAIIFFIGIFGLVCLGLIVAPSGFSNVTHNHEIMFVVMIASVLVSSIALVIIEVCLKIGIAKHYKKSGWFVFGLLFVEPFMIMYLAWDNRNKIKKK